MVNYYKILKVSPKSSQAEIKSAYRRLARKMHPDLNNDDTANAAKDFAVIAKAYEILSNPRERALYDTQLFGRETSKSIHNTDSVFYSDNQHAQRLRQMAIERRYNEIIDQMIASERQETLALQKVIFPVVALFVSIFFVGIFKPMIWTNSAIIGKLTLLTLFIIGVLHLIKRVRSGFEKYTYKNEDIHESIFEEAVSEKKPYTRLGAISFLIIGIFLSLGAGLLVGNFLELFINAMIPKFFSPTLQPEFIFYPPIVVLLVDTMHTLATKIER